jgi:hypothetical protein
VIDLFARLSAEGDLDQLYGRARTAARSRPDEAIELLLSALLHTHGREESYAGATQLLARLLAEQHPRMALSAAWYAGRIDEQSRLLDSVPAIDRARTRAHWAASEFPQGARHYRQAASELEQAGLLARAAVYYERAEDHDAARTLWARLAQLLEGRDTDAYAAGLALFNQARTSHALDDPAAMRSATVAAVHRLEEAADRFEAIGQRERAFDCYHVLVAIGRLSGEFEHVLEGSVNAIRILTEDNLRYHALRLYEHAIQLAEGATELSAAATLAREMTEHARKQGMTRLARRCTIRQANLWYQVARGNSDRGGPPQLSENAYLASLLAAAEAEQYARVGETFRELSQLDIETARTEHYARSARRYSTIENSRLDTAGVEERLGDHVAPPDVWHVDLLEWEGQGSAAEACADVLLDPDGQGDRITRRSALVARLAALAADSAPDRRAEDAGAIVAGYLAPVGLYDLLSPLEKLARSDSPVVRLAAVRALSRYFYKRTFVTLERALMDSNEQVVDEASAAIERLRFDHAFDPLARIYRTSTSAKARLAALKALARIDVAEAAELSLGVLDHGGPEEQQTVLTALRASRGDQFLGVARTAYPAASERLRKAIEDVFQHRGATL